MKEIIPFNLVRMGLAKARGNGIFRSAKHGVSFTLLDRAELNVYHSNLVDSLKSLPYGPWVALTSIVGTEGAERLVSAGQAVKRPLNKRPQEGGAEAGPSKRGRF